MKSGCKRVKSEDGITTPSGSLPPFPGATVSLRAIPMVLMCPYRAPLRSPAYEGFRHAATRETRTSIVTTLLLVLEEVEKEDAYGK